MIHDWSLDVFAVDAPYGMRHFSVVKLQFLETGSKKNGEESDSC